MSIHKQVGFADEASFLKRISNTKLAEVFCSGKQIFDPYAGIGISSQIWAKYAERVVAVEKEPDHYDQLKIIADTCRNIFPHKGDNLKVIDTLKEQSEKFDMIDFDPFGDAHDQIVAASGLLDKGVVCVTSGLPAYIRRFKRIPFKWEIYGTADWYNYPKTLLHNLVLKQFPGAELHYFYFFPTSYRAIYTVGIDLPSIGQSSIIGFPPTTTEFLERQYGLEPTQGSLL